MKRFCSIRITNVQTFRKCIPFPICLWYEEATNNNNRSARLQNVKEQQTSNKTNDLPITGQNVYFINTVIKSIIYRKLFAVCNIQELRSLAHTIQYGWRETKTQPKWAEEESARREQEKHTKQKTTASELICVLSLVLALALCCIVVLRSRGSAYCLLASPSFYFV